MIRDVPKTFGWQWERVTHDRAYNPELLRLISIPRTAVFVAKGMGLDGSDAYAVFFPQQPDTDQDPQTIVHVKRELGKALVFVRGQDGGYVQIPPPDDSPIQRRYC